MRVTPSSRMRATHAMLLVHVSRPFASAARTTPELSRNPSEVPQQQQQAQDRRPRGCKRRSYADADAVLRERYAHTGHTAWHEAGERVHDAPRGRGGERDQAPYVVSAHSPYASDREARPTRPGRLTRARLRLALALFRTPGMGAVMAQLAEVRAYAAYLHGSVTYTTRTSCAREPLNTSGVTSYVGSPRTDTADARARVAAAEAGRDAMEESERRDAGTGEEGETLAQLIAGGHYEQAALLHRGSSVGDGSGRSAVTSSADVGSTTRVRPAANHRGLLQHCALDGIYVGQSEIHSRGLFTAVALPKGTRIITEPQRTFMYAPAFLTLLADTHERLPDTYHYTHPTGSILELVLQPLPHHFMNHSCEANVCCGLSHPFWEAARASGNAAVVERVTRWSGFGDPNSFFVTRDVEAGEELTIDYGTRTAAMFAGESALVGRSLVVCRCGRPSCRHFIYQPPAGVDGVRRGGAASEVSGKGRGWWSSRESSRTGSSSSFSCFHAARGLLGLGFDDETVVLSLLPSTRPAVAYLHGDPMPELTLSGSPCALPCELQSRRLKKRDLVACYRHVFTLLNETGPQP